MQPHELQSIKGGSVGCWIILSTQISYNCFKSKRFLCIDRKEQIGERVFFAHHAITEQLLTYEPDRAQIGIYSYEAGVIQHRQLHEQLEPPPPPFCAQDVHSFAAHRNFAFVLAPPVLVIYHLRTGQLWGSINLPSSTFPLLSGSSYTFWVDRYGATSLGLWSECCIYKIVSPSPLEEQARLVSHPQKGYVPLAMTIGEQYGPSADRLLGHRALDDVHSRYYHYHEVSESNGHQEAGAGDPELDLPLVVKAGVLMGITDDTVQESLNDAMVDMLHELDWLKGKLGKFSSNPIIRSTKSRQRDEMTRIASSFRIR